MSYEGLGALVEQIWEASANIANGNARTNKHLVKIIGTLKEKARR